MQDFLSNQPINLSDDDVEDVERRRLMDEKRVVEQQQFYEIARKRAAELDIYMEEYVLCLAPFNLFAFLTGLDFVAISWKAMVLPSYFQKSRISRLFKISASSTKSLLNGYESK